MKVGLYEQIISKKIEDELEQRADLKTKREKIDSAESSFVLAKYVSQILEKGLDQLTNENATDKKIALVNNIVELIKKEVEDEDIGEETVTNSKEQMLLKVVPNRQGGTGLSLLGEIEGPDTSIAHTSLFTGATEEPPMFLELKKEIASCDRIDMLVSFIKWSGLRLIRDELKEFTDNGGELRVITTSYMGATDYKAIEELSKFNNTKIKVSYDTKRTRLHAKTYIFHRETGFSTAYVGSSNLSNAAISGGLEWNVKVPKKELPDTFEKITATFESYWNGKDFEYYDEGQQERLKRALKIEAGTDGSLGNAGYTGFDVRPYAFQEEILDRLDAERQLRNKYRNLVVAATGTGKTVVSAFDYKRFKAKNNGPCRLLFVAHREEILKQSRNTFRGILRDNNFGDLMVGGNVPERIDHLFISIQSFNSAEFHKRTAPDFYDYIVVDEFHHAAAKSYQLLLEYYNPKILLGLTATPERMDGENVLKYFDNRMAAEIRLAEAIERKLLSPFHYFGVTDGVDLKEIKWTRGGYDRAALTNVYALNDFVARKRADSVIEAIDRYVTDMGDVRCLGFCVSVEHANFMARHFKERNLKAIALTSASDSAERNSAKERLIKGEIHYIFVVDIYNEGVDIPEVNTVLFLRPTESLTVFLQQLGRGLRLAENKDCLTVLDFIGQAHERYNFAQKFGALLENKNTDIRDEIKKGFVSLPKGCFVKLERLAQKYVLGNIEASYRGRQRLVSLIATFEEESGLELNLSNFVNYHKLELKQIYACDSFSTLCVKAGITEDCNDEFKDIFKTAFKRFCLIDSYELIQFFKKLIVGSIGIEPGDIARMSPVDKRRIQMFYYTVWQNPPEKEGFADIYEAVARLRRCRVICKELNQLLDLLAERVDMVGKAWAGSDDFPLDVHCTYTLAQILAAFDHNNPGSFREGVKYFADFSTDVFFVTLNKADKDYSSSTMYKDYSVSEDLFHWQSQSTTSETSRTGRRYINHVKENSRILLFVRENKNDKILKIAPGYMLLGPAKYEQHQGSKPMNIIWKLDMAIPGKFINITNKAVIG